MFPHHTRANECCQLAGHAASSVVLGTLQDHRAFPCNGINICQGSTEFWEGKTAPPLRTTGRLMSPKSSVLRVASARTLEICLRTVLRCTRVPARISFTRLEQVHQLLEPVWLGERHPHGLHRIFARDRKTRPQSTCLARLSVATAFTTAARGPHYRPGFAGGDVSGPLRTASSPATHIPAHCPLLHHRKTRGLKPLNIQNRCHLRAVGGENRDSVIGQRDNEILLRGNKKMMEHIWRAFRKRRGLHAKVIPGFVQRPAGGQTRRDWRSYHIFV